MAKKIQAEKSPLGRLVKILKNKAELHKRLWIAFTFLLKFIALAVPLHLILWVNADTTWLQSLTASHTFSLLNALGIAASLEGIRIFTEQFIFLFTRDCTAWKSMLAFGALVLAAPFVKWNKRMQALAIGIPAIYMLNLFRTVTTIISGIASPQTLEVVHTFLWREGMVLIVFGMWLWWYRKNREEMPDRLVGLEKLSRFFNLRSAL